MSNVKSVSLIAKVPFCWMDEMEEPDAAFLAKTFFTPSLGLKLSFMEGAMEANDNGGRTAMYMAEVNGMEALSQGYLLKLKAIFARYGHVYKFTVRDMEADELLVCEMNA